nr:BPK_HP1_G0043890.mRNA.1.CDS.1 [Saccharomyces cerevisiae]
MVCWALQQEEQPPLEFFMAVSGFRFQTTTVSRTVRPASNIGPISTCSRRTDTITEPAKVQGLYNSCTEDSRTLLMHSGATLCRTQRGFVRKSGSMAPAVGLRQASIRAIKTVMTSTRTLRYAQVACACIWCLFQLVLSLDCCFETYFNFRRCIP